MLFYGLSKDVAARRFVDVVRPLQGMTHAEQNEFLGVLWHSVRTARVTSQYRRDLSEITASVKRTQVMAQANGSA